MINRIDFCFFNILLKRFFCFKVYDEFILMRIIRKLDVFILITGMRI